MPTVRTVMKACWDPNFAVVSPSVERRLLCAATLSAAVRLFAVGSVVGPSERYCSSTNVIEAGAAGITASWEVYCL